MAQPTHTRSSISPNYLGAKFTNIKVPHLNKALMQLGTTKVSTSIRKEKSMKAELLAKI